MRRKISPYVVIDGKFDYLRILTGLYSSLGNYPRRFDHGNIEYKDLEFRGKNHPYEGVLINGITRMPIVGIKKSMSIGDTGSYRVISFPFNWARQAIERFKDYCKTMDGLIYDSSTKKSDTPPPQELVAHHVENLKQQTSFTSIMSKISQEFGKGETVH